MKISTSGLDSSTVIVVGEQSRSTLSGVVQGEFPENTNLIICSDAEDIVGAEQALSMFPIEEIVTVGMVTSLALQAFLDMADQWGIKARRFRMSH